MTDTRGVLQEVKLEHVEVEQVAGENLIEEARALIPSIREFGLLNPASIVKLHTGHYRVIAGRRRTLALQQIMQDGGPDRHKFLIWPHDTRTEDLELIQEIENGARRDPWLQRVALFRKWLLEDGQEAKDICQRMALLTGKTRNNFYPYVNVAKLPEDIFLFIRDGLIGWEVAKALVKMDAADLDAVRAILDEKGRLDKEDLRTIRSAPAAHAIAEILDDSTDDDNTDDADNKAYSALRTLRDRLRGSQIGLNLLGQIENLL